MQRAFLIPLAVTLLSVSAHADDRAAIDKVKSTWRAQDGETAEQIFTRASKVAHFVPRKWEAGKADNGSEFVTLSWAKRSSDKTDDEYAISWELSAGGQMVLGPPYAKPMELGWQAFALSLISSEVTDEEKGANVRFLHDAANFNFVTTPQGEVVPVV